MGENTDPNDLNDEDLEEKASSYADSAKEVQDKLGLLTSLLEKRGDKADPALKEQLKALQEQLEGLGIGQGVTQNTEQTKLLDACLVLSVRRAGGQRPSVFTALKRFGDTSRSKKDAADSDLAKMTVACIHELSM